jgi:cell division protein FtsW
VKLATTILVSCVASLLALGTVMLCSSPEGSKHFTQQLLWEAMGIVACGIAALFDYRKLKKVSPAIFGVALILLAAVFLPRPVGLNVNGAHRWINLQVASFQPSEFAKLALIIVLAHYIDHYGRQMSLWFKPAVIKGMLLPGLIIGPVLGLIFLEPDYGTTLLLAAVASMMLIVAGARLRLLVPVALIGLAAVGYSIQNNQVRSGRMDAYFHPERHRDGKAFQQEQAMIALGSGGVVGLGLGDGRQKFGYVPENHTDFILAIIGEELGLVATLGVVLAFLGISVCGIYIAMHASDRFGMMLGCGITFLISLQSFINIGVVTTVLPNKGLPLPFVSYGGSSVLMMLTSIGLLLSVARRANEPVRRARGARGVNPFNRQDIPSTQVS